MTAVFLNQTDERPPGFAGCAAAIGNFDGVHRGHLALVAATIRRAKELGGPAVAVSFDPPPYQVLFPHAPVRPPLTDLAERTRLLHAAGIDRVAILRTTPDLLALTPERFFADVIVRQLGAKALVEGFNFRFGVNRSGNTNTLRSLCSGAEIYFEEVPPFELDGETVSSSRVRAALMNGDVSLAERLLGRLYAIAGTVVKGAERGRTLGFPTANLSDVHVVLPGDGVYAVRAKVSGEWRPAAANIGPNPTFGDDARKIEVHVLDFAGDLYGSRLELEFTSKLRDTHPFATAAELIVQLKQDVEHARDAFR
jgi:riboflavin kinase/FMN adenylyltransferase